MSKCPPLDPLCPLCLPSPSLSRYNPSSFTLDTDKTLGFYSLCLIYFSNITSFRLNRWLTSYNLDWMESLLKIKFKIMQMWAFCVRKRELGVKWEVSKWGKKGHTSHHYRTGGRGRRRRSSKSSSGTQWLQGQPGLLRPCPKNKADSSEVQSLV